MYRFDISFFVKGCLYFFVLSKFSESDSRWRTLKNSICLCRFPSVLSLVFGFTVLRSNIPHCDGTKCKVNKDNSDQASASSLLWWCLSTKKWMLSKTTNAECFNLCFEIIVLEYSIIRFGRLNTANFSNTLGWET